MASLERVRLLEFGMARLKKGTPLTAPGMVMGSPSFMAPEAWQGLSALLDTETRARRDGRRLVLVPPPDPVMQVFRITLLDQRFEWHQSPDGDSDEPVAEAVGRLRRRVGGADL